MKKAFFTAALAISSSLAFSQPIVVTGSSFDEAKQLFEAEKARIIASRTSAYTDYSTCYERPDGLRGEPEYRERNRSLLIPGFQFEGEDNIYCAELIDDNGDGVFDVTYLALTLFPSYWTSLESSASVPLALPEYDNSDKSIRLPFVVWYDRAGNEIHPVTATLKQTTSGQFEAIHVTMYDPDRRI